MTGASVKAVTRVMIVGRNEGFIAQPPYRKMKNVGLSSCLPPHGGCEKYKTPSNPFETDLSQADL
jgi:hypothetical protein